MRPKLLRSYALAGLVAIAVLIRQILNAPIIAFMTPRRRFAGPIGFLMVNDFIPRTSTFLRHQLPEANSLRVDSDTDTMKFGTGTSGVTEKEVADLTSVQTLTNKTLTAPTLTSPVLTGATGAGQVITKACLLTEAGAATSYTATFALPAGAVLHNIRVIAQALWNGTSATLKVGDGVDDDGYFIGVNLKAADLLVGEVLSVEDGDLWGGKNGAYLVAATGQRGPVATNFGQYYPAGTNITAIVTPGAADGTLGRTLVEVEYSVPTAVVQVAV